MKRIKEIRLVETILNELIAKEELTDADYKNAAILIKNFHNFRINEKFYNNDTFEKIYNKETSIDILYKFKKDYHTKNYGDSKNKEKECDKMLRVIKTLDIEEKNTVLFILKEYPSLYANLKPSLLEDKDVCLIALKGAATNFRNIPNYLMEDENFCFEAFKLINRSRNMSYELSVKSFSKNVSLAILMDLNFQNKCLDYIYESLQNTSLHYVDLSYLRRIKSMFIINKNTTLYEKYTLIENYTNLAIKKQEEERDARLAMLDEQLLDDEFYDNGVRVL